MKLILSVLIILTVINFYVHSQVVGTQAPDFTHYTLDHGQISLSNYHGKVVYLFFFGWG
jgi:peroxiredoxin